jgi:hypothetical protein
MRLARYIENAFYRYLSSESDATLGGMHVFKAASGAGASLQILKGHNNPAALPEAGFILVESLESECRQVIPNVNHFTLTCRVALVYPIDNIAADATRLVSFDDIISEMEHALLDDELPTKLSDQGEGIVVQGFTDGITFQTRINESQREAEWGFSFAAHGCDKTV